MNTDMTKKLIILAGGLLLLMVAYFFLFWYPNVKELKAYQVELSKQEAELIRLEQDARDWPESITREKLSVYENELENLWMLIPSREEVAMLLDEIQNHARNANLEIIQLNRIFGSRSRPNQTKPGETVKQPKYVKVPYRIVLGGNYTGVAKFIQSLEDSDRLITISKMTMSYGRGIYPLDAEIEFNIFYSRLGVEEA
ncbi:type 4a pilus biogenesis protein PilO [Candidatus Poribacteria bacterium]|nr:type 4a pilus biogenesis protein PilO [Candidatus Poribacteria bacterium]